MTTRVETWQGHNIRFVLKNDEWWAILSDVCKALGIDPMAAFMKLDETTIDQVENLIPSVDKYLDIVNEVGIYELMFLSNLSDANRMRFWTGTVLKRLRNRIGLSEYEVMRMMDGDIQEEIDNLLDDIFYDEETGKTMISVTVAGGDVEQVPIEDILKRRNRAKFERTISTENRNKFFISVSVGCSQSIKKWLHTMWSGRIWKISNRSFLVFQRERRLD